MNSFLCQLLKQTVHAALIACGLGPSFIAAADTTQYVVFNRAPGQGMYQGEPESLGREAFDEVLAHCSNEPNERLQTALSHIFSVFRTPPETTVEALRVFLDTAEQTSTPIVVQIDFSTGECGQRNEYLPTSDPFRCPHSSVDKTYDKEKHDQFVRFVT